MLVQAHQPPPSTLFYPNTAPGASSGASTASDSASSLPGRGSSDSMTAPPNRTGTFSRPSEELHLPTTSQNMSQHGSHQTPTRPSHPVYSSSAEYASPSAPNINLQQATPETSSSAFPHVTSGPHLPGALQTGSSTRPGPPSANTAPTTVPTMPQLSTQQAYHSPSRSTSSNHSHNYSRSSPGGFDGQKYIPYSSTPESKYASPTNQKYTPVQLQPGAASHSPLGLADIRPRADSGMSEDASSANPYSYDGALSTPSNSNYLAPWAIYAFDWCKWSVTQPSSGPGAGKVAVGSYLEDGHNFVSLSCH